MHGRTGLGTMASRRCRSPCRWPTAIELSEDRVGCTGRGAAAGRDAAGRRTRGPAGGHGQESLRRREHRTGGSLLRRSAWVQCRRRRHDARGLRTWKRRCPKATSGPNWYSSSRKATGSNCTRKDGSAVQARLSYVSPYRGTYVFTNRKGQKIGEFSMFDITSALRIGPDDGDGERAAVRSSVQRTRGHAPEQPGSSSVGPHDRELEAPVPAGGIGLSSDRPGGASRYTHGPYAIDPSRHEAPHRRPAHPRDQGTRTTFAPAARVSLHRPRGRTGGAHAPGTASHPPRHGRPADRRDRAMLDPRSGRRARLRPAPASPSASASRPISRS